MTDSAIPSLTIEQIPIDLLRPDPANPRRIGEDELDALERSLRSFGFVQPILARHDDGMVVGGHQRLLAARRQGLTTVPLIWLDLRVEKSRLVGLALDKISGCGMKTDYDSVLDEGGVAWCVCPGRAVRDKRPRNCMSIVIRHTYSTSGPQRRAASWERHR